MAHSAICHIGFALNINFIKLKDFEILEIAEIENCNESWPCVEMKIFFLENPSKNILESV